MTRKTMRNIKRVGLFMYYTINILIIAWIVMSTLNVGFNNSSPDTICNIWSWNFYDVVGFW